MMNKMAWLLAGLVVLFPIAVPGAAAEENQVGIDELKKQAPKIYIDCDYCDIDFIRTEITFVNYVWDRREADVHILITTQRTGGGGEEYTLTFIGQNDYKDFQNVLKYAANQTDTDDDIRRGLVHMLKMGLVSLAARTPIQSQLDVSLKEEVSATAVEDKWNFWVFSLGANGFLNGETSYRMSDIGLNLSANRVTPESKLQMGIDVNFEKSRFSYEDETISSSSESQSLSGLFVKSLGEHWSAGIVFDVYASTYRNMRIAVHPTPALEYNLFPYSESTRRQLRFLYSLGYTFVRYREETIYDKTRESLLGEALSITLELKEPWGTIETSLEGSHYFHDLSKYRLRLSGELSLRLFKGLSFNVFGSYSRIHDQLSLPKGGASLEEVLLQRRELASSYDYFAFFGLSYSFGSIYSNVVNPRFGSHGLGRTIIIN